MHHTTIQNKFLQIVFAILVSFTLQVSCAAVAIAQQGATCEVYLDKSVAKQPITGRLLVFFSKRNPKPMNGPDWFNPEPFFGLDVKGWEPGTSMTVDDSADSVRSVISELPSGEYFVQAILDHDFYCSNHANGPGNFFSKARKIKVDGSPIELKLDQEIPVTKYTDSKFVKFVEIQSKLLEAFHHREVIERAMVVLPRSYESQPDREYPVYYVVTGFGGTLKQLQNRWFRGQAAPPDDQTEFIRVYLTGQCKWGHHVYANSANNGPRGDALIQEMIPEIDQRFRTIAQPTARFVGGHSSGGWSSLWLQVTYPDKFSGVWSTAPDPVDFRDWQGTNLYAEAANVYYDANGNKKPLARVGQNVLEQYADFTKMDDVLGRGGQIRSFEAVFSPRNKTGLPYHCWDRSTGDVNVKVVDYWKVYDISLILKNNWQQLEPKLSSKIHIYMGELDTFYLEGATIKLKERLDKLGSDATIEIFPGADHGSLLSTRLRNRILREMSAQFWKHHPKTD